MLFSRATSASHVEQEVIEQSRVWGDGGMEVTRDKKKVTDRDL